MNYKFVSDVGGDLILIEYDHLQRGADGFRDAVLSQVREVSGIYQVEYYNDAIFIFHEDDFVMRDVRHLESKIKKIAEGLR